MPNTAIDMDREMADMGRALDSHRWTLHAVVVFDPGEGLEVYGPFTTWTEVKEANEALPGSHVVSMRGREVTE